MVWRSLASVHLFLLPFSHAFPSGLLIGVSSTIAELTRVNCALAFDVFSSPLWTDLQSEDGVARWFLIVVLRRGYQRTYFMDPKIEPSLGN
jgi:hypothetical protein